MYRRLREAFGGQVAWAIVGGAPLGERLAHFYRGIGLPVLEGYGLTETSAAIVVNTPDEQRIGTVGKPLRGTEVRVDSGGELRVRGPQVFSGYWNNPSATAACLDDDGWFATGDLGDIDDDGYMRILGRQARRSSSRPAERPSHRPSSRTGFARTRTSAIASWSATANRSWRRWSRSTSRRGAAADHDPELVAAVQSAVDSANAVVSQAEAVRKFVILDEDWTQENGYLTPSLKVKRSAVLSDFHDTVEALFVR